MEWKKISEKIFKAGYRTMIDRVFIMPDGREETYTVQQEREVGCILPLTADGRVVLAKQYRPGPEKLILELPGGGIEEGEDPLEAAKRELLEETGYVGDVSIVGTGLQSAYSTMKRYHCVARNCRKISESKPDQNEIIEVTLMSMEDFRKHLQSGELTDVATGYRALDELGEL